MQQILRMNMIHKYYENNHSQNSCIILVTGNMKLLIFHKLFKEVFYMVIRDFEVNQWLWHTALLKLDRMNWQKYWISAVFNWDIKLYSLNLFRTYKIYLFFCQKCRRMAQRETMVGKCVFTDVLIMSRDLH